MTHAVRSWTLGAAVVGAIVAAVAAIDARLGGAAGVVGVVVGFTASLVADALSWRFIAGAIGAPPERFLRAWGRAQAAKFGTLAAALILVRVARVCALDGVLHTMLLSFVLLAHAEAARLLIDSRRRDRAARAATGRSV